MSVFLAEFHILWCLFHSFIWKWPYQDFERRFALVLAAASIVYLFLYVRFVPEGITRLRKAWQKADCYEQRFLIAFFLWFVVDCAIHQLCYGEDFFKPNDWKIFQTALAAFVFFPLVQYIGPKKARRTIEWMMHLTIGCYGTFCAFVLWKYLRSEFITFPSGRQLTVALHLAMQVGVNPNITASQATVMLAVCIFMIITQKKWVKIVYLLPSLVFVMVLMLSNSRTSYLAALSMVVAAVIVYFGTKWKNTAGAGRILRAFKQKKGNTNTRRYLLLLAALLMGAGIFWIIRKVAYQLALNSLNATFTEGVDPQKAVRVFDGLNGRAEIWAAALIVLFSSPKYFFLGMTPGKVGQTFVDLGILEKVQPHCHNILIQVAASLGVPAMLFYAGMLVSLMIRSVRIIRLHRVKGYETAWAIPIILSGILLIDVTEAFLFGPSCVNMPVFFLFSGWLTALDKSSRVRGKRNSRIS